MKPWMRTVLLVLIAALLVWAGRLSAPSREEPLEDHTHGSAGESETTAEAEIWTCPMHAQIRLPAPGDCPICGMDLVRLEAGSDLGPRRMAMSPEAVRLARIRTSPVVRRTVHRPVRMVGKVALDETAVKAISAWVPGRIDRMFVDYTGVPVREGEHLFELYSPDLLTAQEELLSARERLKATSDDASEFLRESTRRAYRSAREKLLLWGLSEEQVDTVLESGTAGDRITIHSPTSGTIMRKRLDEGDYVETGTPVYEIADLSRLWVLLDAYEQDLPWVRFGQSVTLQAEALPGQAFEGTVSFVPPVVHDPTRTVKVRVNVSNPEGRLKPGMFVRAVIRAELGAGGAVAPPRLAGKWVSPMHPEIVKDEPGTCDVCGMPLVPAEELGLAGPRTDVEPALIVPTSAVLVTGTRAVVYVEVPDTERPTYEGREIVLGPRAEDHYVVRAGLAEDERVVTHGAFRIDSSMQIQAKRSMLSMPAEPPAAGPEGEPFRASLGPLYDGYLELGAALAGDDEAGAHAAADSLPAALDAARPELLPGIAQGQWEELRAALGDAVSAVADAGDLQALRVAFEPLSRAMLELASTFGSPDEAVWYELHCPMAFDGAGAPWLQRTERVANPYFGASMLRCGDVRRWFVGARAAPVTEEDPEHEHEAKDQGEAEEHAEPEPAPASGDPLLDAYLAVHHALAADRPASAEELEALTAAAEGLDEVEPAATALAGAEDLADQRAAFRVLSDALIGRVEAENRTGRTLHVVHCPMAFDFEGADWLQVERDVSNPYFGAEMPSCGSVQRTLEVER